MDATDVEPMAICPDCGQEMQTAHERCAGCQARKDEFDDNAADPRRG